MPHSEMIPVSFSNIQLLELPVGTIVHRDVKPLGHGRPALPVTYPSVPEGKTKADMPHTTYELVVHALTSTDTRIPGNRSTFDSPEFLGFYCHVPAKGSTILFAFFLYPVE